MPKLAAALLLSTLTVGLVVACGSQNAATEDVAGDGGTDPNGPGLGGDGGPQLCKLQSQACTADADCCSGICDPGTKTCKIDTANSTCRPTGEVCGSGSQSGCCLRTKEDDLCKKDPFGESRCALPPTTCKGLTATCAADSKLRRPLRSGDEEVRPGVSPR